MSGAGEEADHKRRRLTQVQRQTRWLAALLEGLAMAAFVALFLRGQVLGPSVPVQIACAFIAAAVSGYMLWPLVNNEHGVSYWRAAAAGFVVIPLGGFLWPLLGAVAHSLETDGKVVMDMADILMMPVHLLLFFGWGTVPLGVAAAVLAAAWGNASHSRRA
jgi:hypothetical protein